MGECLNGDDEDENHRRFPDCSAATGTVPVTESGITIILKGSFSFGDPVKENGLEAPLAACASVTDSATDCDEMIA
jgi:hypothetical protein